MPQIKNHFPKPQVINGTDHPGIVKVFDKCPECGGAKWFSYSNLEPGHPYFARLFPCPVCNKIEIDRQCGLKEHERGITLANVITTDRPDTARMIDAARKFIEKPRGFLSIHGSYGNGKSTTLMAITNEIIKRGIEARYITALELMDEVYKTFKNDSRDTDYGIIKELAEFPVLCIDEAEKFNQKDYPIVIQQGLFNLRYRDAGIVGTVLAWNGELNALPFPSVVSRIQEFAVVSNNDRDLRPLLGEK